MHFDEDGTLIGDYLADLLVEGELIVELKTAKTLANEHEAQILGYLKAFHLLRAKTLCHPSPVCDGMKSGIKHA